MTSGNFLKADWDLAANEPLRSSGAAQLGFSLRQPDRSCDVRNDRCSLFSLGMEAIEIRISCGLEISRPCDAPTLESVRIMPGEMKNTPLNRCFRMRP